MQRLTTPVRDVVSHVFVPITQQITDKFLSDLGLKDIFKHKVYINSDSSASSESENDDHNPKLKENRALVNMVYNLNPLNVKWPTATFNDVLGGSNFLYNLQDTIPLFQDTRTQTTVFEKCSPANIELTITLNFVDRVLATEAINSLIMLYTAGEKVLLSDFAYNYPMPVDIVTTILGIYKHTPMEEEFLDYLVSISGGRISYNVNRHSTGTKKEIVVKKHNAQVVAQIDYDGGKSDAIGTNDSADIYQVQFALTLQFAMPRMQVMTYPIIVQNQVLPEYLITTNPKGQFRKPDVDHPYFSWEYYRELVNKNRVVTPEVVNIPWYDGWSPNTGSPLRKFNYREFLTVAFTLDNVGVVDGTTSIDITSDLPYALIPEVLEQYALGGESCLGFDKPFNISVYVNDVLVDSTELEFDGTTLVVHRQDINPIYRLVLSEYIGGPNGSINTLRVIKYDIIAQR